jgi:hypothetical protein
MLRCMGTPNGLKCPQRRRQAVCRLCRRRRSITVDSPFRPTEGGWSFATWSPRAGGGSPVADRTEEKT